MTNLTILQYMLPLAGPVSKPTPIPTKQLKMGHNSNYTMNFL